ncbi:hypothetical protein ACRAQ7_05050 [Erythrobacter sp. W53]|uniref:hypothetical protein n=1 Tax=Erythrobacter sp. W53 TaxID=3425947 RepID=UPI003D768874
MQNITPDRDDPVRLTARVVLLSIVGLWLCYFVLITLRGSIVGLDMQTEMLWRRAIVAVAGIVITCGLWQVIRLVETRGMLAKVTVALLASLPAALLIAQINHMMFAPLEEKVMRQAGEKQGANVYRDEAGNLLIDVPGLAST